MTVIQEMKEAKLRYLADTMKDYAKWLSETSQEQYTADRIKEFAETIEEVLAMNDGHFFIKKTLDIRRLEDKMKVPTELYYKGAPDYRHANFEAARRAVEDNLLHYIKKNKLIEVKVEDDGHGFHIASASLYVGIRPQIHFPNK